jgi:transcriptional regulator with XRE-family HTH domain
MLHFIQRKVGDDVNYRERMKSLREDKDLTQAELGRVLNKSQQGYNHIEAGRAELKIDDLIKLCDFYGVSADYLIGRADTKE